MSTSQITCLRCGYRTSNTDIPRCPKCGNASFSSHQLTDKQIENIRRYNLMSTISSDIGKRICFNCGLKIEDDWKGCPSCGQIIPIIEKKETSCPKCGNPIEPNWIRCPECLAELKKNCDKCGAILKSRWKACPECGRVL